MAERAARPRAAADRGGRAAGSAPGWTVLRTGMGPARARIAAARGLAVDAPAVAVVGLCAGGRRPSLRAGDVVCATEVRREGAQPVAVPGSALARRGAAPARPARARRAVLSVDHVAGAARAPRGSATTACSPSTWSRRGSPTAPADGRSPSSASSSTAPSATSLDPRTIARGHPRAAQPAPRGRRARRVGGGGRPAHGAARRARARSAPASSAPSRSSSARSSSYGAPVYVRSRSSTTTHVVADLERRGAVFVDELDEVPDGRDRRLRRPRRLAGGARDGRRRRDST